MQKFVVELGCLNWQSVLEIEGDASQSFDILSSIVEPIFDKTCPVRTVKRKKQVPRKPWIHEDILNEIENLDSLYELYLNSENDEDSKLFRLARNEVNYPRSKAKKLYYEQKLL